MLQNLLVDAGIVSKVRLGPPSRVPSGRKEQKIDRICLAAVFGKLLHADCLALAQVRAVDHKRLSEKLLRRKRIERRPVRKQVRRRVHVRTRVGVKRDQRLFEAVFLIAVRRQQLRRARAGIDRHVLFDRVRQVNHAHRIPSSFPFSVSSILHAPHPKENPRRKFAPFSRPRAIYS